MQLVLQLVCINICTERNFTREEVMELGIYAVCMLMHAYTYNNVL